MHKHASPGASSPTYTNVVHWARLSSQPVPDSILRHAQRHTLQPRHRNGPICQPATFGTDRSMQLLDTTLPVNYLASSCSGGDAANHCFRTDQYTNSVWGLPRVLPSDSTEPA